MKRQNFAFVIAIGTICWISGIAFNSASQTMPIRTEPETYGYSPFAVLTVMLIYIFVLGCIAGKTDNENNENQ